MAEKVIESELATIVPDDVIQSLYNGLNLILGSQFNLPDMGGVYPFHAESAAKAMIRSCILDRVGAAIKIYEMDKRKGEKNDSP